MEDVEDVLRQAKIYAEGKGFAVEKHPCRDRIRKAMYYNVPIYRIHKKTLKNGRSTISENSLWSYKNDPIIWNSVMVEYNDKKRKDRAQEKLMEERNPGIQMCYDIIRAAGNIDFRDMTDEDVKLATLAIQASKTIPILKKAEPDIVDYEEVATLDTQSKKTVKEIADYLARQQSNKDDTAAES